MQRGADLISKTATIRTVVGTGHCDLSGDGGPAVSACLNEPKGIMLDGEGNLFIADSENHAIRKVDRTSGTISTIAGHAEPAESRTEVAKQASDSASENDDPLGEEAMSGSGGFVQQADLSGTVRYVKSSAAFRRFGGDGGPATGALFNFPTAVAIDRTGHLYVADTMNHRVRRIDAETGRITTLAGTGLPRFGGDGGAAAAAGLNEPAALAVSDSGILYVADQSNHRIRAIDLRTGLIRTIAGIGTAAYNGDGIPAIQAALAGPSGLAVAVDGTLFIADTFNGRIRAIDPSTGMIGTVAGDGGEYHYQGATEPSSGSLSRPSGIAVDIAGNVFLTDSDNHLVRRWDRITGRVDRVAGVGVASYGGDGGPASEASLNYPFGIVVDGNGTLFIADTFNHRIREILV